MRCTSSGRTGTAGRRTRSGYPAGGPGLIEGTVDEFTTKTYRLTREDLVDLVDSVDSASELPAYLSANEIEAASSLQDSMSSGPKGAMRGWKAGSAAGSFAGLPGLLAGGVAGMSLGYVLATKFGDDAADEIQKHLRDQLGLNTDQEFEQEGGAGDESSLKFW